MHPIMRHLTGGVGHLLLLLVFVAFSIWYASDAYRAQQKVENLLLIWPAALVVLVLALILGGRQVLAMRRDSAPDPEIPADSPDRAVSDEGSEPSLQTLRARYGTPLSAIGLGVYVMAVPFLGFDVSTALFVAASMRLQGERNLIIIAAFALVVATLPVMAIESMLSVPVPTLVLP